MPSVGLDSTPAADSNAGMLLLPNSKGEPAAKKRVHAYQQHAVEHRYGEQGEHASS
jgi:hypothetical protein